MSKYDGMTDEELVIAYIEGSNKAFDVLLERNQSKLFSYIFFVVRSEETANDIFQDTMVKVILHLQEGRYISQGKFSSWLMRIAHNAIMDWYRDCKADKTIEPNLDNDLSNVSDMLLDDCIEGQYVNEQVMRDVRHLMDLLVPTQREVVFMRFYQQMSFKEIAETTGVSINTSLGRMRYAILNMRRMAREKQLSLDLV